MQNKIKGVFVIKINYDVIKTIIKELKTYYNMYDADFVIEFDNNTNEENVLLIYTNNEIVYQIDKFPTASKTFNNLLDDGTISYYGQYFIKGVYEND